MNTVKRYRYQSCYAHSGWLEEDAAALSMLPTAMLSTLSGVLPPAHRFDGNAVVPVQAITHAAFYKKKDTYMGGREGNARVRGIFTSSVGNHIRGVQRNRDT